MHLEGENGALSVKAENLVRVRTGRGKTSRVDVGEEDEDEAQQQEKQQQEEDAEDAQDGGGGSSGGALVGRRVSVLWREGVTSPTWFDGEIVSVSSSRGHRVKCKGLRLSNTGLAANYGAQLAPQPRPEA